MSGFIVKKDIILITWLVLLVVFLIIINGLCFFTKLDLIWSYEKDHFKIMDLNKDNRISNVEWIFFHLKIFREIDKNKNAYLSGDELRIQLENNLYRRSKRNDRVYEILSNHN